MAGKKGMPNPVLQGNKGKEAALKKKLSKPAFNGTNPRTMTEVSGFDKYAPDPDDEIMEVGKTYNDVILVYVAPEGRKIGINDKGTITVPYSTVCYLAHKDVPYTWHSPTHYHYVIKVSGRKMFPTREVDRKKFGG